MKLHQKERRKEMKNINKTSKISVITLILILTLSAILVSLPLATAQFQPSEKKTFAYLGAIPNPVGVGQDVTTPHRDHRSTHGNNPQMDRLNRYS